MRTSVRIVVSCTDAVVGKSMRRVLAADNKGLPPGLALAMDGEGPSVGFKLHSESASTALSTSLAILRDISLFEEVWLLTRGSDARVKREVRT